MKKSEQSIKLQEEDMRKEININEWERKGHFEYYSRCATPHYCVAFNIDVTNLLQFTRKNNISFYYSLIYLCTQSINEIDEFLLETENNKVYKIDRRVPCFTDLMKDATSFHMVSLACEGDIIEYATKAREESRRNPLSVYALEGLRESQIIYSCIPWADITMCSNERDYTDPNLKDDTAPILVWGKYTEQNGKYMINMTLDVNHRFIDGYFVGQFVQKLDEKIAELDN